MRQLVTGLALATLPLTPLHADGSADAQDAVRQGAERFFAALRSDDKTALAAEMVPGAMIFVHNRMDPANPRVDTVAVTDHLARWAKGTRRTDEAMRYDHILVDGDMAQVWGPYAVAVDGKVTHCGINSLSMVRTEGGWKVGNTSFTMVAPDQCAAVGAPELGE